MRYIITYRNRPEEGKHIYLVTYAAEIADSAEQAIEQFSAKHPDKLVLSAERVDNANEAFMRYGTGSMTDEEREEARDKLRENMDVAKREREEAEAIVMTFELDEFAAAVAHEEHRATEETQNLEGVHVGDLFFVSWGYEQTNYNFFQVVGLRGKHTIVVRENERLKAPYGFMRGLSRPIRNRFDGEERYNVRTRLDERTGELRINAPRDYGYLRPCKDGQCFDFSSYA